MKDLVFGLISSSPGKSADPVLKVLRELTLSWSRYGYQGTIIEGSDVDDLLQKVTETEHRFCLIQSEGHVIDEQWYPPTWNRKGFYGGIHSLIHGNPFLVAGEWEIHPSAYPGLKADCLLVNMNIYKSLGNPDFGKAGTYLKELYPYRVSSGPAILPGLTDRKTEVAAPTEGWNFISLSLENGLPVSSLTPPANKSRFNLNADFSRNDFGSFLKSNIEKVTAESNLTPDQSKFLNKIKTQLKNAQNSVFLWNIESYDDLLTPGEKPIGTLFCVAAGFKPVRILAANGWTDDTSVVYYDYSKIALEIRKDLVENFDGDDFPHFVRYIFRKFPYPATSYSLWEGVTPDNIDPKDIRWFWEKELEQWGGAESFKSTWRRYQQLPHEYLPCNLLGDKKELLHKIHSSRDAYIWWSNAFFTIFSNWFFSYGERKQIYEGWVESLALANPDCLINGSDINNSSVNGITAGEYFEQFSMMPHNELVMNKFHKYAIRY